MWFLVPYNSFCSERPSSSIPHVPDRFRAHVIFLRNLNAAAFQQYGRMIKTLEPYFVQIDFSGKLGRKDHSAVFWIPHRSIEPPTKTQLYDNCENVSGTIIHFFLVSKFDRNASNGASCI